jgi:thymidylate kinase
LDIAAKNPKRCVVIDATQNIDVISAQILEQVKNHV